jgi:hypothetical protein
MLHFEGTMKKHAWKGKIRDKTRKKNIKRVLMIEKFRVFSLKHDNISFPFF